MTRTPAIRLALSALAFFSSVGASLRAEAGEAFKDTALAKSAPPALRSLIEDGDATVEFVSDPEFVKADTGNCAFHLHASYRFKYKFKRLAATADGRARVRITVSDMHVDTTLSHHIRIPDRYAKPKPWETRLLLHEFDHLAISLDPRPKALLDDLVVHLPPFERTLEPGEEPTGDFYKKAITDEANRRKDAVTELIQAAYRALDETSAHGVKPLPDRPAFFQHFFTREHLAEERFPFLDEAAGTLASPAYLRPVLRFLPKDPTTK